MDGWMDILCIDKTRSRGGGGNRFLATTFVLKEHYLLV